MKGPPLIQCVRDYDQDPLRSVATQFHLLDAVAEGRRPVTLYVYSLREDVAALGRFHLAPEHRQGGLHRRIAGGRILPMGRGYAGIALLLPRRDSTIGGEVGSLSPARVMNRHVRGFLHGCRAVGIDPVYPGRDVVTVGKRIVASLALETDRRGAAVFDMVVAVSRTFAELPAILDRADPEGITMTRMATTEEATHLEVELGRRLEFGELVALVRRGFGDYLGCEVAPVQLDAADEREIDERCGLLARAGGWVHGRSRTRDLAWRGSATGQIGAIEVYFAEDGDVLQRVISSGDFIANSAALEILENRLAGCRRDAAEIDRVIAGVFSSVPAGAASCGANYLLGLGDGTPIRDAILRGERW